MGVDRAEENQPPNRLPPVVDAVLWRVELRRGRVRGGARVYEPPAGSMPYARSMSYSSSSCEGGGDGRIPMFMGAELPWKKLSIRALEAVFARVLALLAVLLEVIKFVTDFVGDGATDDGSEVGGVRSDVFVARVIIGGSLHLSRKALVMVCL